MSETPDQRLLRSKRELALKLARFCAGRSLDKQTIIDCENIYADHRSRARMDGVDFPEMVPLVMDLQNRVTFVRRDLGPDEIDNLVVELAADQKIRDYYAPAEIARAVRRAFPRHRRGL